MGHALAARRGHFRRDRDRLCGRQRRRHVRGARGRGNPGGAALALAGPDGLLDVGFLFVRIFLPFMVHVPAERDEEFVDEVFARFLFLVIGAQVIALIGLEVVNELFYESECVLHVVCLFIWQRSISFVERIENEGEGVLH